ncbi:DeoR family transcriptional regulator [Chengkuizengella axinellae]|uniref:DeoR family transcriptional regulator n=1 Tax=Chengkuizengella axinellae TaxID=3064388 RepID=A0ABT9J1Z9_9BACL|nr:DeoR family transcriptional regulator [Chengkuizengella sp. 2205SS18-9]MDP5275598.1 DeoR family transcriptional regulator [Chengkuizengella sp. 2205SS18-9]
MLPAERKHQIMELIRKKKTLKISDLSEIFEVSEMTIHRDIKPLIEEGMIIKTFGGISLNQEKHEEVKNTQDCIYCYRPINQRLAYRLILQDQSIETTCCAHCGLLRHQQLGDKVLQAICPDFLLQTTISAASSWFLMDTSLILGCCQPQVLSFQNKEHAEKFASGFGGKIYSYSDATEEIFNRMQGGHKGCCD